MTDTSDQFKQATLEVLIKKSYDAAKLAYVPYSKFICLCSKKFSPKKN